MDPLAYTLSKWTLNVAGKLVRADVRMHNAEAIQDDMAIVFVVNHFTRIETLLLPYEIYHHTGKEVSSLAAAELFTGRLGTYLRNAGTVSTKDPDRDKVIVRSLLQGERPWVIFPEGQMIKDKKVVNARGEFRVWNKGKRRPPHTGAAALALRAEFYRRKIECIWRNPKRPGLDEVAEMFQLEDIGQVLQKRTVIVPVNITYFPMRSDENLLVRMARSVERDLSPRALDELSVEGTLLSKDSDIDITLGEPIPMSDFLDRREYAPLMACGDDLHKLEHDPRSLFNDAAREVMLRYMLDIYENTTVNYDHLFATIIRYQRSKAFTERAYRNRIFLAAKRLVESGRYRVHNLLETTYRQIIYEDPSPKFHSFMDLCIEEGLIEAEGETYRKNFKLRRGTSDFHSVRQEELTYVIANEIEPLTELTDMIKEVARTSRRQMSRVIGEMFLKEDRRLFDKDYRHYRIEESHPKKIGRPFLLKPNRIKAGIVLVHGYLAAPEEIRAMAEFLKGRGYAVYGVRLRGHGTAPEDLAQATWEDWYESLNRGYTVIKSLTDRIILGGFSTGAALALLGAGRKGSRLAGVFAVNAPLQLRQIAAKLAPSIVTMNTLLKKFRQKGPLEFVGNDAENEHINYRRNPVAGVKELAGAMAAMAAALPAICVPTYIVQGSRDPVVDPASGKSIFDQVGTMAKELTYLERDRHGIINGDGADRVFERIDSFLRWALEKQEPKP